VTESQGLDRMVKIQIGFREKENGSTMSKQFKKDKATGRGNSPYPAPATTNPRSRVMANKKEGTAAERAPSEACTTGECVCV
jgi:hypothetical protein